jgi:hypothetical protein
LGWDVKSHQFFNAAVTVDAGKGLIRHQEATVRSASVDADDSVFKQTAELSLRAANLLLCLLACDGKSEVMGNGLSHVDFVFGKLSWVAERSTQPANHFPLRDDWNAQV